MSMVTRPPRSGLAGRSPDRGGDAGLERGFALLAGAGLIGAGLLGSFGSPLVGRPEATSLLVTGPGHDVLHLVAGALFLHVGVILIGRQRSLGVMALGAGLLLSGLLSLVAPDLLGLYGPATSGLDQLAHLGLGVAALAIGWQGLGARERRAGARGSRASGARRRGP